MKGGYRSGPDLLGERPGDLDDDLVMRAFFTAGALPGARKPQPFSEGLLKRDVRSLTKHCLAEATGPFDLDMRKDGRKIAAKCRGWGKPSNMNVESPYSRRRTGSDEIA